MFLEFIRLCSKRVFKIVCNYIYSKAIERKKLRKKIKKNFKTDRKRIEQPTSALVAQRLYQLSHIAVSIFHTIIEVSSLLYYSTFCI